MADETSNGMDAVWRALSDPTRRSLLDALRNGPQTTGQLVARIPTMSRFGVMKHLGVLVDAGLVITRKEGRKRWNYLNAVPLKRVMDRWVSTYEDNWADALIRLKTAAERNKTMSSKILDTPVRIARIVVEIIVNAPREEVFRVWLEQPNDWFYESDEARNAGPTRIQNEVGGKFYFELPDGGFNVLADITMIKPGHKIRMRGDCTCPEAFVANMTTSFEDVPGGTRVTVDHRMSGEFSDDLPEAFDEGWADGLAKLKAFVER
jgi:DNA-binding transcriptional ArsR family regulator/uncharacterized protein YndB with AHSA1/START domain